MDYDVGVLRKKLLHGNGAVALYSQSQCLISTSFISNFIASSGFFFFFCVLVGRGVMMWRNSKINQCCRLTKSIPGFLIHCIQLHRGALHRYWSRIYGQVGEKLFPGISHRDLNCCLGLRSNQSRSVPVLTRISVFWLEINHPIFAQMIEEPVF